QQCSSKQKLLSKSKDCVLSIFYFLSSLNLFWCLSFRVATNGLALGEEADFEAQNSLPALNLIRSTKLQLSTEPAFLPNACYVLLFCSPSIFFLLIISPVAVANVRILPAPKM